MTSGGGEQTLPFGIAGGEKKKWEVNGFEKDGKH